MTVQGNCSEGVLPNVIGKEAELVLKDLFGAEQKLSADRGRIIVLNFWATWCGPGKKEMPDLAAIQNQYAAYGVQVVGASADTLNELQAVRQSIKETAINFPVWLGVTTEQMAQFGLGPGLPGTAIIGRCPFGRMASALVKTGPTPFCRRDTLDPSQNGGY
jgi:thiol-disulfide isomerase/thioredoxin